MKNISENRAKMSKFVDIECNSGVAHQVIHQVSIKVEMNLALQRLV